MLILGESKVGKTSILQRYTEGVFTNYIMPTLGIDYRIKRLKVNKKDIKLQIWDTAGQEKFRAITQNFYRGSMGIILVYDVNDPLSFSNLTNWVESIYQFAGKDICLVMFGNKCDLP